MKKLILLLFTIVSFTSFSQHIENDWNTDMNKAIEISHNTEKPLMLFFTGSDWCGWCIKLQKAVFSKPDFVKWATKNVVLVELDFPRRTKISEELTAQNRNLQQMFGVRGYPTVWFVTPEVTDGKVNFKNLGSQGASPLDAKGWIAGANKILEQK
ncbi:MAG: thioredoxin family protein [Flavobacteriales bacterium]|nr:thioredoxin family protein [Flavobacteriales bacterium]